MWRAFFKALAAAGVGGAAFAVQQVASDPNAHPKVIGTAALTGATVGVLGYLAKSPLPTEPPTKEEPKK